jgi:phage-related protein
MAITTAVADLFKSAYELVASLFAAVSNAFSAVFSMLASLVTSFMTLVGDILLGVLDIFQGVGKFVLGNIILLALVAAGGFAFVRYQKQQKNQSRIGTGKVKA